MLRQLAIFLCLLPGIFASDTRAQTCRTTTFYMHMSGTPGQKISLAEAQVLPDGRYAVSGNTQTTGTGKEGVLMIMGNDGAVILQKKLRINNIPVVLYGSKTTSEGNILVAGVTQNSTPVLYIAQLTNSLAITWQNTYSLPSAPQQVTLNLYDTQQAAVAVQTNKTISCIALEKSGAPRWSRSVTLSGTPALTGFSKMAIDSLTVVANNIVNGKKQIAIIPFDKKNGGTNTSWNLLNDTRDRKALGCMYYSNRLYVLNVEQQTSGDYILRRNRLLYSTYVIEKNTYRNSQITDDNITAAITRDGHAMGICIPASGSLLLVKHYADDYDSVQYTKQYSVPTGASIASTTRSYDGGYLLGVNTPDSSEIIFIKTDSIGIVSECAYTTAHTDLIIDYETRNTPTAVTFSTVPFGSTAGTAAFTNTTINTRFDCRKNYCPEIPDADICLSSYYKLFRSAAVCEYFRNHLILRNNRQWLLSVKEDQSQGGELARSTFIRLLDENGKQLQTKEILAEGQPTSSFDIVKLSDSTVMLMGNAYKNGTPYNHLTLLKDDLTILWTHTVSLNPQTSLYSTNNPLLHQDREGNFYLVACNSDFTRAKPLLVVYKLNAQGKTLWMKTYETSKRSSYLSCITSTYGSLIIICDGYGTMGNVTIRLDKQTGNLLNSYESKSGSGNIPNKGSILQFNRNQLFFAGGHYQDNNKRFVAGTLDTTGKPLKFRTLNTYADVMSSVFENNLLYSLVPYYAPSGYKEVILCMDTAFNIAFARAYSQRSNSYTSRLQLANNGSIYTAGGHHSYNNSEQYPTIVKYTSDGTMGTCGFDNDTPEFTDVDLQVQPFSGLQEVSMGFSANNDPLVAFIADTTSLDVSAILCGSQIQCNQINIQQPGPVCRLQTPYTYKVKKNTTCTIKPRWTYDPDFVTQLQTTDTSAVFLFKQTGVTQIKALLNNGCQSFEDSVQIDVQHSPASFSLGNDTLVCSGDSIILNAGNGFSSYLWQNQSTDSVFTVKTGGKYYVQAQNSCGDLYADTILIKQIITPVLFAGKDTAICIRDTITLTASPGFTTYQWLAAATTLPQTQSVQFPVTRQQQVIVNGYTNEGCHATDTLSITTIQPQAINLGKDTSFCTGQTITLQVPATFTKWQWNTGAQTPSIQVSTAGSFQVKATDANGCRVSDTLITTTYPAPVVVLGSDQGVCTGDTLQLDAGSYSKYQWQDGKNTRMYSAFQPGSYYVSVIDANGCTGADTLQLTLLYPLPAQFLKTTDSICQYEQLVITPSRPFTSYIWSDGSTQPSVTISKAGRLILKVTDQHGCSGADTITINSRTCMEGVYIPTAFSPNNDQLNDVFRAKVFGPLTSFRLAVYNRWGELIFETTNPSKGWNGNYKGAIIGNSSYVWMCTYQQPQRGVVTQKGTVTIIK